MYNPEVYWNEVAANISKRNNHSIIAGDDEPYYVYKRKRLLELIKPIQVQNKKILEFGCGPGGNLQYFAAAGAQVSGVDIAENMLDIAKQRLAASHIDLQKINSPTLPYSSNQFDIVFTVTVLQHNTDEAALQKIIAELGRVSNKDVYLFERIEKKIIGHESNTGRPIAYYQDLFTKQGYHLKDVQFMPIQASYFICGIIRKIFSGKDKKEGEPLHKAAVFLQKILLPFTSILDQLIPSTRDLAKLHFQKDQAL